MRSDGWKNVLFGNEKLDDGSTDERIYVEGSEIRADHQLVPQVVIRDPNDAGKRVEQGDQGLIQPSCHPNLPLTTVT
jgi:hypothetical protein